MDAGYVVERILNKRINARGKRVLIEVKLSTSSSGMATPSLKPPGNQSKIYNLLQNYSGSMNCKQKTINYL
jgi:hypothetical protein